MHYTPRPEIFPSTVVTPSSQPPPPISGDKGAERSKSYHQESTMSSGHGNGSNPSEFGISSRPSAVNNHQQHFPAIYGFSLGGGGPDISQQTAECDPMRPLEKQGTEGFRPPHYVSQQHEYKEPPQQQHYQATNSGGAPHVGVARPKIPYDVAAPTMNTTAALGRGPSSASSGGDGFLQGSSQQMHNALDGRASVPATGRGVFAPSAASSIQTGLRSANPSPSPTDSAYTTVGAPRPPKPSVARQVNTANLSSFQQAAQLHHPSHFASPRLAVPGGTDDASANTLQGQRASSSFAPTLPGVNDSSNRNCAVFNSEAAVLGGYQRSSIPTSLPAEVPLSHQPSYQQSQLQSEPLYGSSAQGAHYPNSGVTSLSSYPPPVSTYQSLPQQHLKQQQANRAQTLMSRSPLAMEISTPSGLLPPTDMAYQQTSQQPPSAAYPPPIAAMRPLGQQRSSAPPQPCYPQGGPLASQDGALEPKSQAASITAASYQSNSAGPKATSASAGSSSPQRQSISRSSDAPRGPVETLTKNANNRIDPAFVPRPLYPNEPISQPGGVRYETTKYTSPPPPYGVYTVLDKGSASCRFIRMTMYQIPTTSNTLSCSGIPLAAIIQPFPYLGDYEPPVPVVDLTRGSAVVPEDSPSEGPPRCPRCHAYICPFLTFHDECNVTCNFCLHKYRIASHYQFALSEYHKRASGYDRQKERQQIENNASFKYDRPEVLLGTVDFLAPDAFFELTLDGTTPATAKVGATPTPHGQQSAVSELKPQRHQLPSPAFCIMLDAGYSALRGGLTHAVIESLKTLVQTLPENDPLELAIMTFDKTVKCYPIGLKVEEVRVMASVSDPFVPASPTSLCANVVQNKDSFLNLLDRLPTLLQNEASANLAASVNAPKGRNCGNAALKTAVELLGSRGGGTVIAVYDSAPDMGVGALQPPPASTPPLPPLSPLQSATPFYTDLLSQCLSGGVCVDVIGCPSAPNQCLFISSLSFIARHTGGHCLYFTEFNYDRDFTKLSSDLIRRFYIPQGYDCVVKVRCSRGLSVSKSLCHWALGRKAGKLDLGGAGGFKGDPSSCRVPRLDADSAMVFEVKHETELPEDLRHAYIQCAVLYTSRSGSRLIRVSTLALSVTNSLTTAFRYSEVESVLSYMTRNCANSVMLTPPTATATWRDAAAKQLVEILAAYRMHCANTTSSGQLILPDSLKALPVYLSGLFKHPAFRTTTDIHSDERDFWLLRLITMPLHQLILAVYPRLFPLKRCFTNVKGEKLQRIGTDTGCESNVYVPPTIASSGERITTDGIFLMDNGSSLLIYVGIDVAKEVCQEVFGVDAVTSANSPSLILDPSRSPLSSAISKVVSQIQQDKGQFHPYQPLRVVPPRSLEESRFIWQLVEDRLGAETGYVDFLCQLHKAVHVKLDDS